MNYVFRKNKIQFRKYKRLFKRFDRVAKVIDREHTDRKNTHINSAAMEKLIAAFNHL